MDPQTTLSDLMDATDGAALVRALGAGEFALFYQPIVDLATRQVVGAEALTRWPAANALGYQICEVVETLELAGLVDELDSWVLGEGLRQLATWQDDELVSASFCLNINVSSLDFDSATFAGRIARAVNDSGVDPSGVVIEITETQALTNIHDAQRNVAAVHEMGMHLALDDFGSGYSNFARLHALTFDVVKIDRCFTQVCRTEIGSAFIDALVGLARCVDARVIAEGIETPDAADRMHRAGCDAGQGFLWAPAVPASLMESFLRGTVPLGATSDRAA
ncbi:MAG: EAL domain-containing protein [Acidimicrobiia bacterium]